MLPLPSFKRMFFSSAPLPHLTSDDVDKALQNSPRLMHARNTGKKARASFGNWIGALYVHPSLHTPWLYWGSGARLLHEGVFGQQVAPFGFSSTDQMSFTYSSFLNMW